MKFSLKLFLLLSNLWTPHYGWAEGLKAKDCDTPLLISFHAERKPAPIQTTVNNLMVGVLKLFSSPNELRIENKNTSSLKVPGHDFFQQLITLPELNGIPNGVLFSESILIHEYTHAVFYQNFISYSKSWATVLKLVQEFHKECKAQNIWPSRIGFIQFITKGQQPNIDEILDDVDIFTKILAPLSYAYQELFSDLVSVVELNNPNVVSEMILSPFHLSDRMAEVSQGKLTLEELKTEIAKDAAARNFSGTILNASWPAVNDYQIHRRLAPTRIYLWETYFSKINSIDQKAKMLRLVFDSIAEEILELQNIHGSLGMDSVEMNRRLMNRLQQKVAPTFLRHAASANRTWH